MCLLFSCLSGSLAHSVSDPAVALAGASGGCYALIGAHVATIIMVTNPSSLWAAAPFAYKCLASGILYAKNSTTCWPQHLYNR